MFLELQKNQLMIYFSNLVFQTHIPRQSHTIVFDYYYYHDDVYKTGFDYYSEEDYFLPPPKNIFEKTFSKIPTLSERQAGPVLAPLVAGVSGLVTFSGKNFQ